jgi:AcrR family transcriptional regulator
MPDVMPRDAQATRRRLLDAAAAEFAAVGIAGARVDRIAEAASSNKAQIYHYFGSKDELFDAVFEDMCRGTVDAVPIDATDLAEYAGRLHDSYVARPWVQRLATWYRLERGSRSAIEVVARSYDRKLDAIARAQAEGLVTGAYTPVELLGLVLHLSGLWTATVPEFGRLTDAVDAGRRREVVVRAVRAVLAGP